MCVVVMVVVVVYTIIVFYVVVVIVFGSGCTVFTLLDTMHTPQLAIQQSDWCGQDCGCHDIETWLM